MNPQNIYHGILVNKSFENPHFPEKFKVFAKHNSTQSDESDWVLYGIEIPQINVNQAIKDIQTKMRENEPWYAHLYNNEELIAIFKNKVFQVTPQSKTWDEIIAFGDLLGIPSEQLTFWPNRFQDEIHYFKPEDFIK